MAASETSASSSESEENRRSRRDGRMSRGGGAVDPDARNGRDRPRSGGTESRLAVRDGGTHRDDRRNSSGDDGSDSDGRGKGRRSMDDRRHRRHADEGQKARNHRSNGRGRGREEDEEDGSDHSGRKRDRKGRSDGDEGPRRRERIRDKGRHRSCMKSQMASLGFTDVFAALVAIVNTKFPEVGLLLLKRIVLQLKRAYKRNDKMASLGFTDVFAALVAIVNTKFPEVGLLLLKRIVLQLKRAYKRNDKVAVGFVKECGALLQDFSPQGLHGIFERFRGILHEGERDKRVQFLIEGLFAIRKAKFQGFPAIRPELDLVEQEDQFTHEISLEDEIDPETNLDVFKPNPQFLDDEKAYENIKKSIHGMESSGDEEGSDAASDDEDEEESEEEEEERMKIKDETETNLVNLQRTIYLTIMSSVDFEEAGHKLLKIKLEPGQGVKVTISAALSLPSVGPLPSFRLRSPNLNTVCLCRVFDLFDRNGDGEITVDKLTLALDCLGLGIDCDEISCTVGELHLLELRGRALDHHWRSSENSKLERKREMEGESEGLERREKEVGGDGRRSSGIVVDGYQ
ncbi:hypothetical protein COCNU_12G004610 [Cocos nucifera]|uniref:EF-hand domain-containing protein n=1 Tax=Cocos nucifera TaxID=13894 RepID=A0A8K0IRW6_COCNU|nr:hypothetical protein COCNU_12G004610 [Cocos nucifera]